MSIMQMLMQTLDIIAIVSKRIDIYFCRSFTPDGHKAIGGIVEQYRRIMSVI